MVFRPPEYAALINPAHNAFANVITTLFAHQVEAMNRMLGEAREKALSPEAFIASLRGLGPKEWSPIGEYKLKVTDEP